MIFGYEPGGRQWHESLRRWLGYIIFTAAVLYGLWKAPQEVWGLDPAWLAATCVVICVMFILQILQVYFFIRHHALPVDWHWLALFTARKAVLNTVLPAKTGTLLLIHMITRRYSLRWHEYVAFILTASILSLGVSVVFLALLILPSLASGMLIVLMLLMLWGAARSRYLEYSDCLLPLSLISLGLYGAILLAFWCLLRGLGHGIGLIDTSYFAIALNALAQVAITPGNIGLREMLMGMLAPYLAIPVAVGILAGAIFFALRLALNGLMLAFLEFRERRRHGRR